MSESVSNKPVTPPANGSQKPLPKQVEQVGLRVSLIPAEELNRHDPRVGFKQFLIASGVALIIFVLVIVALLISIFLANKEIVKINTETQALLAESTQLTDSLKDAKLAQTRLRSLGSLLSNHRNTQPIFEFLEKNTLPDVFYPSISIAENGTVNLSVEAGSFESYAGQINQFRNQTAIKSIISSGMSPIYDASDRLRQVNFTLALNFDPSIFLINRTNK